MNYYEHHMGDYAKDTMHLSLLEHGIYRMLLDRYYSQEGPLPCDVSKVQRLIGARTQEEREAVEAVLDDFFVLTDDGWRNGRADEEIEKAQVKISAARENGRRGGRPKKEPENKQNESENNPAETHWVSSGSDLETQPKAHQTPDTRHQTPITPVGADKPPNPEKFYFEYGKSVLGGKAGGLLTRAKTQIGEAKALSLIRESAEKQSPREYFSAALLNRERWKPPEAEDEYLEGWRTGQSWN